ncbi:hypothetical protein CR205_04085 [Alteribacter lacisalsi]|uniref:WYL domain-containing protein n=1 Tax=Alteribacter lacisalsi TaxID=2045244 RepID=A0A2W0HCW0_9BACI|nr:hypothetical protein [Alteribacter lacisalsi]PYZ97780.1 hypothetical protein CR205_04085 [Alteribacter lacisalsi]
MEGVFRRSMVNREPVEMIYMSKKGTVTKRVVTIRSISAGKVTAFCHLRRAVRTFRRDSILSVMPVRTSRKKPGEGQIG